MFHRAESPPLSSTPNSPPFVSLRPKPEPENDVPRFLESSQGQLAGWLGPIYDPLIIDNDPNATHLVKVLLERTGHYLVLEENDATQAHHSARNFRPDLILLDVVMPETDGGEVAAQIEADPELHETPIVFLTALVTRAEAKSGLSIQGHPILAKPVSIPELINAIEQYLPVRVVSHVSL